MISLLLSQFGGYETLASQYSFRLYFSGYLAVCIDVLYIDI